MSKTKVLLAFGLHGGKRSEANGNREHDTQFFRTAIIPFLEEHVENGGRKALVIYEGVHPVASYPQQKVEAHFEKVMQPLNDGSGVCGAEILSFGFEDRIIGINTKKPGQVLCRVERQPQDMRKLIREAETQFSQMKTRYFDDGCREMMIMYITKLCDACIARNAEVFGMAEEFRKKNPDAVVIVPRSTIHRGMASLFENSRFLFWKKYDVDTRVDEKNTDKDPFILEAMDYRYSREIYGGNIERLARLQRLFEKHLNTPHPGNDKYELAKRHALAECAKHVEESDKRAVLR